MQIKLCLYIFSFMLLISPSLFPNQADAQSRTPIPERAVRRDIPMTNAIRRAFAAGTRDSTGRPGPKYWQLWLDYTINARLDPATSRPSGSGTRGLQNRSDSA